MLITPVILAGGSGERLWPLSKREIPKQFLLLSGSSTSLFQDALLRVGDRSLFTAPLIVCNIQQLSLIHEQLAAIGITDSWIIAEPVARNTAAALALATVHVSKHGESGPMLVMPADHHITDEIAFHAAVTQGAALAEEQHLVTFAAHATEPSSDYGYIQAGLPLDEQGNAFYIHRFIEKPDLATATVLLAQGNVGMNCGIFLLLPETALLALSTHAASILSRCRAAIATGTQRKRVLFPDAAPLRDCIATSIDYAVMEHVDSAVVIPVSMGWSDLGSFAALTHIADKDGAGNSLYGVVTVQQSRGSYVYAQGTTVAALGLEDMLVIATREATLIAPKQRMHELRLLQQEARPIASSAPSESVAVVRPWGRFYSLDHGIDYQVKRLHLNPGARISLQSHQHRSEHWVVTSGRATVTHNEHVRVLETNQSTYIPAGTVHRLENHGCEELVVIEVQTGDYLGEDDIVRLEDSYDRA